MNAPRRVAVFAVGNTARGDDGLAPELAARLRTLDWDRHAWLQLIEDAQLQIEHALDLQRCELALFVDASSDAAAPFTLSEIGTAEHHRPAPMSHALEPRDVLHTLTTISRESAPPCFVLAIRGESFELGEALSQAARENLEAATQLVLSLLETPEIAAWRAQLS